ncbi:transposase [Carnobacterium iners]|uniref:transposase n=1 Tax=Carnobacterium iners TaxID=1073423 RepID=UPI0008BA4404|nr:transposase [Carnobacterium iners]SEK18633.1 ATPase MipZ [Carnobacterium iners]
MKVTSSIHNSKPNTMPDNPTMQKALRAPFVTRTATFGCLKLGSCPSVAVRKSTVKSKKATLYSPHRAHSRAVCLWKESQVFAIQTNQVVGIDRGVVDLMVLSTGDKVATIRFDKHLSGKQTYWEQHVSRRGDLAKAKGITLSAAKNYQKAKQQRAKVFQKEKNQRTDRLHKLTAALVQDFEVIVLKDLHTANRMKNHHLVLSIAAQS